MIRTAERSNGIEGGRRILLVEDDPFIASTTQRVLRSAGWTVDLATDGDHALTLYRTGVHQLVLLDLQIPGVDGLGVLGVVRDSLRPPPVIVMSGHLDLHSTRRALDGGAIEVLEKPVPSQRLIRIIDDVQLRCRRSANDSTGSGDWSDPATLIPEFIGVSPSSRLVREQAATVTRYRDLPVLIIGETGTGKEVVAQAIHRLSTCSGRLVAVNCAAVTEELFESELFGHEAGAFSGARTLRRGLFEEAGDGTVFLDEVGEMPASQQAKLLRVLETRSFRRVGSNVELPLRARIVCATNRPLRGRDDDPLRADLFFRIAGFTIRTPTLRDRMDDLDVLADHFLREFGSSYGAGALQLSPRARDALHTHTWPGNVRELRGVIRCAAVCAHEQIVSARHIVDAMRMRGCLDEVSDSEPEQPAPRDDSLPRFERDLIMRAYEDSGKNVSIAARRVGIPRTTLRDKLRRYGVR